METDSVRPYGRPEPVSSKTVHYYQQFTQSSTPSHGPAPLPESDDLVTIKADLERLLPLAEDRLRCLQRDLGHLEKNGRVRDHDIDKDALHRKGSLSGKNMNVIRETMRIKQEQALPDHVHTAIPKSQLDRQAALETLRRRRRREDVEHSDEDRPNTTRSESPHHMVKLKKLDGIPSLTARSVSPPVSKGQKNFSNTNENKKKKASSKMSSGSSSSSNHRQGQPTMNGNGKQVKAKASSAKNSHNDTEDFVRVKAKDQIPVLTFWEHVKPYFRTLTEEDREFLMEKGDQTKPYIIPPLGQHYLDTWAEEDRATGSSSRASSPAHHARQGTREPTPNGTLSMPERLKYLGPHHVLTEDYLLTEDLSCGGLTERLLSSLVAEGPQPDELGELEEDEDDDAASVEAEDFSHEGRAIAELSSHASDEILNYEERLKRELRYVGLFGEDDGDWHAREDDEISAELRSLGRQLEEQVKLNDFRKQRLLHIVDRQLGYEQYRQALDNFDAQVEESFTKRYIRSSKSKKRKTLSAPKGPLSENAVYAMEKRRNWINGLGSIFKERNHTMPTESIYKEVVKDATTREDQDNGATQA